MFPNIPWVISKKNLFDIWNDEKIKKLRESFLSGTKPKSCEVCWVNEASNKSSLRQDLNGFLNPKDPQWCKPEYKDHIINDTNDDFTVKKLQVLFTGMSNSPVSVILNVGCVVKHLLPVLN